MLIQGTMHRYCFVILFEVWFPNREYLTLQTTQLRMKPFLEGEIQIYLQFLHSNLVNPQL
ncbi:MAG: hypothetical protein DSY77_16560 [Bacteroidetes bacterium]|nr:MAG: hypothetical protein DSY77_16560 [Bacteroidota bacterium]